MTTPRAPYPRPPSGRDADLQLPNWPSHREPLNGGTSNVAAIVERWAAERPDAVAMTFEGVHRTWAQLQERVGRVSAALRAFGLGVGERVAVLDLNHPACLEITLACARVGAVNVVVNARLAAPEIAYVINDAGPRVLFVGPSWLGVVEQVRDTLPGVERVIGIGDDKATGEYESWIARHDPDPAIYPADPGDCFLQLYTSGTTGFPKGAMLTHRGMRAVADNAAADFDISPGAPGC